MPGGKIAPDGRPPQAGGVGKNSKRHDLEAPATPGLHGSDLQSGDVGMLERGQQIAPRPKQQQASAAPAPRPQRQAGGGGAGMEAPDAIEFASKRIGGQAFSGGGNGVQAIDSHKWTPLLRTMALAPNSGGNLAAALTDILTAHSRQAVVSNGALIDLNALDETIAGSS